MTLSSTERNAFEQSYRNDMGDTVLSLRLSYEERLVLLLAGDTTMTSLLLEACQRPLALLTMKKAVERLPVEVLPEGIVQVQQQVPVQQRLRALKEARDAVASSLGDDADSYLQQLQDIVAELDADDGNIDYYLSGPSVQRKGITF